MSGTYSEAESGSVGAVAPRWTPGPWEVRDGDIYSGETLVAEAYAEDYDNGAPELHANARLIAAAPELAEACNLALPKGVATDNRNIPDEQIIPLDFTMGELRRIAAALAKAGASQ